MNKFTMAGDGLQEIISTDTTKKELFELEAKSFMWQWMLEHGVIRGKGKYKDGVDNGFKDKADVKAKMLDALTAFGKEYNDKHRIKLGATMGDIIE